MDDLVQWLHAQLDEDEQIARAAAENLGDDWYYDDGFVLTRREDDMVATGTQDFLERERGEHIALHNPARVLREIDAKRRTLIRCEEAMMSASPMLVHFAKQTAWEMTRPYADRPGYKEPWRP